MKTLIVNRKITVSTLTMFSFVFLMLTTVPAMATEFD